MRNTQLSGRLALQSGVTRAEAADRLDRVIHQIISNLRRGRPAALPGLGKFLPGDSSDQPWIFTFEDEEGGGGGDAGQ